jgi:hypothetical protein
MTISKTFSVVAAAVLCAGLTASDAVAQSRGHGGGRGPSGRGPSVGRVAPRGSVRVAPRPYVGSYRGSVRSFGPRFYPSFYFPRYRPYARYYSPYYYRPGISVGIYAGFGYPYYYGYYGYPYYSAGYPYYGGYGYGGYNYPYGGYNYPYSGVAARPGVEFGEVRIEDAPKDAQVYADGRLVGSVGDFDGPVRHLPLEAGSHTIEVRIIGIPPLVYDVDVRPGQTLTIHANAR